MSLKKRDSNDIVDTIGELGDLDKLGYPETEYKMVQWLVKNNKLCTTLVCKTKTDQTVRSKFQMIWSCKKLDKLYKLDKLDKPSEQSWKKNTTKNVYCTKFQHNTLAINSHLSIPNTLVNLLSDNFGLNNQQQFRYCIVFLTIANKYKTKAIHYHSNSILIDCQTKTLFRFEPYGQVRMCEALLKTINNDKSVGKANTCNSKNGTACSIRKFICDSERRLNNMLQRVADTYGWTYTSPKDHMQVYGPQYVQEQEPLFLLVKSQYNNKIKSTKDFGFCSVWAIVLILFKLRYPRQSWTRILKSIDLTEFILECFNVFVCL